MITATKTLPAQKKPIYFGALDGFRGVLAVAVAIYHTFWYSSINSTTFFNNGTVLIDLFFVFSGFLMYRLYHNRVQTPQQAGEFFKRRFARLYPIHLFMLGIWLAFSIARILAHELGVSTLDAGEVLPFHAGSAENWKSVIAHLTMTHSMGVSDSLTFNPPSWTISVEVFAYIVFVLMFMFCPPTKTRHFILMAAYIAVIYAGLAMVKPNMDITYDLGFFRCLGGFFTGVIASWLYGLQSKRNATSEGQTNIITATMAEAAALAALLLFVIYMPGKLQFFIAPFAFLFVFVFAFDSGLISRFMSNRVFLYLAKISYSVYMVHAIFAFVFFMIGEKFVPNITVDGHWSGNAYLLGYLFVVIGFSHLSWMFVERPGQKYLMAFDYGKLNPFRRYLKV